jgi:glucose/arabinose dehydrogenase
LSRFVIAALAAALGFGLVTGDHKASGTIIPSGFLDVPVTQGLTLPTAFDFAPDGRIFVAEKAGVVRVVENGLVLATPVLDVSGQVNDHWDRGMLGLALDPEFATNGYLYVTYVYESPFSGSTGPKTARLSRFTVTGNTAQPGSETVLLGTYDSEPCADAPTGADCLPADSPVHTAADVRFAPDGTLFVTTGDSGENTANDLSLRAQDLNSLAGKVLHIYRDGSAVESNPFWTGDAEANRSKVYAYGFRNPFRIAFEPGTGTPYLGDVGWYSYEEVNIVHAGMNYGWPCYEGPGPQLAYATYAVCQSLYFQGADSVKMPLHYYGTGPFGASVIGGDFPTAYPAPYTGKYFFADYVHSTMSYATVTTDETLLGIEDFAYGINGPVTVRTGPNGELYYLAINTGRLRRIHSLVTVGQPSAVAGATPQSGPTPLQVQFSSAGSSDPDLWPLSYQWDFGDGSASSTEANPTHTYTSDGSYTATLTVTDRDGLQASDTVGVKVGSPPTVSIDASPTLYSTGDTISYSGSAFDPDTGPVPSSSLEWTVVLHHLSHNHFFQIDDGPDGSFLVPDHGDNSWFEIALTATDASGLETTESVFVHPREVQVTIESEPPGLYVLYEGRFLSTPSTVTAIANSERTIVAPSPQLSGEDALIFESWSDGGEATHTIDTGGTDQSYTATFGAIPANLDDDGDGCTNGQEVGLNPILGGLRDMDNYWDFFDVWREDVFAGGTWRKDRVVDMHEIVAIAQRFGTSASAGSKEDALSPPTNGSDYHAAYDRTYSGPYPWNLGPPDGSIGIDEIFWAVDQFAHTCWRPAAPVQ